MKKFIVALISSMIVIPAYAKSVELFVDNRSDDSIVIVKNSGESVNVPAHSKIERVSFNMHTVVQNYSHGKNICSWTIRNDIFNEIKGIGYGIQGFDPNECVTFIDPRNGGK